MSALARLWSLRKDRPAFVALVLATLLLLAAYPVVDWWLRAAEVASPYRYYDFGAFRNAVERWRGGAVIYERSEDGGFHGTFLYPPVALGLFLPFGGMGFERAAETWNLATLALLWLSLQAVADALECRLAWWERVGLLWLLVGFHPLALSMKLGQLGGLMGALLSFALVALVRGEEADWPWYASGALTGVVGVVKLAYAPVGAHLLASRERLAGAVATGALLATTSVLAFGLGPNLDYLAVLWWGVERGGDARPPTAWLPPYYRPIQWLPAAQWLRAAGVAVVASYAALAPREDGRLVFALGVTAFPLLTPLAYTYYFVALLPAVAVLLAEELERGGSPRIAVAGLVLVQLHAHGLKFVVDVLPELFPPVAVLSPYWFLQPGLWGNLLLFGLAMSRVAEGVTLPSSVLGDLRVRTGSGE